MLLHLVVAVLTRLYPDWYTRSRLRTVYVTYANPFPNVDAFVKVCESRYKLDCFTIGGPMKEALQTFLDQRPSSTNQEAIFVGIRRHDPYAGKRQERIWARLGEKEEEKERERVGG